MQWRKRDQDPGPSYHAPSAVERIAATPSMHQSDLTKSEIPSAKQHASSASQTASLQQGSHAFLGQLASARHSSHGGTGEGSLRHWASRDSSHKENASVVQQHSSVGSIAAPLTPAMHNAGYDSGAHGAHWQRYAMKQLCYAL